MEMKSLKAYIPRAFNELKDFVLQYDCTKFRTLFWRTRHMRSLQMPSWMSEFIFKYILSHFWKGF